jgi:hypothetical protein
VTFFRKQTEQKLNKVITKKKKCFLNNNVFLKVGQIIQKYFLSLLKMIPNSQYWKVQNRDCGTKKITGTSGYPVLVLLVLDALILIIFGSI